LRFYSRRKLNSVSSIGTGGIEATADRMTSEIRIAS